MKHFLLGAFAFLFSATFAQAQQPNHLLGARSPYLLQHLYNPVDWYPWGPEALEKAKAENKPIFVSVGYSSCHWCHVMREESFENEAIAALLNQHFVSIKIDRENRPDLDEQFQLVTELLTGGGGWPNSVFLTPDAEPFLAGGYLPPANFAAALSQVQTVWRNNPQGVTAQAARVAAAVNEQLTFQAEARAITPEFTQQTVEALLAEMDGFYGGYGVAPKFPREPMFLFLLDEADRTGSRPALQAVTGMLDGMIQGGVHDQVGGGFHRYAVDPEWHVPHFEKMLYNQAMMGRLLIRAFDMTGAPRYRRAAERTFDYVLRELRDPDGGFYSAQDADSLNDKGESIEGAYYAWTPAGLEALGAEAEFAQAVFHLAPAEEPETGFVLTLSASTSDLAAARNTPRDVFVAQLDAVLAKMQTVRKTRPAPFLDPKIVVSWNGMMIETLAEAAHRLDRPDYRQAAEAAAQFILDRMNGRDGLKRVWFEGEAHIPAQLSDYAALGLAFVALHDYAPKKAEAEKWLQRAQAMAKIMRRDFGDPSKGYRLSQTDDGLSEHIPRDDVDIPSGNALALSLLARLGHRLSAPDIVQDGYRLAAALSGHASEAFGRQTYALNAIRELEFGETGIVRHTANGVVRVELRQAQATSEIAVDIDIADGWHINAHQPLEDYLIATRLDVSDNPELDVAYPNPITKALSFSKKPLALYEGTLRLQAPLPEGHAGDGARRAKLTLQACNDEICLQPEEMVFVLWR